ncbi:hypothetical protein [Peribacillus sp. TH16]|uniref:hypothetical protein n=1 Tax=Peribacillus sp. TH16 TaxID=2798482 RepID=UPI001A928A08|nr:hypothetical protein [Peribacillus sp. TH16]
MGRKYGLHIKPRFCIIEKEAYNEKTSKIRATRGLMRKGNKIKSVGVFINVKLQEYVIQFLDDNNLNIDWY